MKPEVFEEIIAAAIAAREAVTARAFSADEKGTTSIRTPGGPQQLLTVTEPGPWTGPAWRDTTFHLGTRFDPAFEGPGLKVKDVVQRTPADNVKSRISPGEIVLRIDGKAVDSKLNLATVTTGVPARDLTVTVRD